MYPVRNNARGDHGHRGDGPRVGGPHPREEGRPLDRLGPAAHLRWNPLAGETSYQICIYKSMIDQKYTKNEPIL